jgi:hypothetical protein
VMMMILCVQVLVDVNRPPEGGDVTVSPVTGAALSTNFTLHCLRW